MSEEQKQSASSSQDATKAGGQFVGESSDNAAASTTRIPLQHAAAEEADVSSQPNVGGAFGHNEQSGDHPAGPSVAPEGSGKARPAPAAQKRSVGLRRIRMTISKVDILSVIKLGFLLSVVFAFMVVIAMAVIWFVLDGIHVFSQLQGLLETLNSAAPLEYMQYLEFGRWMSFAVIIAILDVVLLTALSAIGALVYNLVSSLVGGLRISVTDE